MSGSTFRLNSWLQIIFDLANRKFVGNLTEPSPHSSRLTAHSHIHNFDGTSSSPVDVAVIESPLIMRRVSLIKDIKHNYTIEEIYIFGLEKPGN